MKVMVMVKRRFLAPAVGLALLAAARAGEVDPTLPAPDYRSKLYLACTLVFACLVVLVVISHRRSQKVRQDLTLLERRLDSLEGGETPPAPSA